MAGSFQNEIPPARVNIKLDIDKGGAQKKVELPFKMLVLGDFTGKEDGKRLVDRDKININKDNFNQVMESLDLGLNFSVENKINPEGGDLKVDLKFKNMKSFDPLEIVKQVPQLSKLLAARNLVKDLKSNLMDNKEFRRKLEAIMQDQSAMDSLVAELDKIVPMEEGKAGDAT
ncbi:MAG TPA: type VI secretion system contractile sheath small subunit [Fibrobacteria bacterium]|nr:type VI secretion system contractile sheath small subunit [Fibrobacteria bacterium]